MGVLIEDDDMSGGECDSYVDLLNGEGVFEDEVGVCLPKF